MRLRRGAVCAALALAALTSACGGSGKEASGSAPAGVNEAQVNVGNETAVGKTAAKRKSASRSPFTVGATRYSTPVPRSSSTTSITSLRLSRHGSSSSSKAGKIARLVKAGSFALSFRALMEGRAVVAWHQIPSGARLAKAKAKPVLVASGTATVSAAGT